MTRRRLKFEISTYVRLPKNSYKTAEKLAREKGLPVSQFLRMLVLEKLKEIKGGRKNERNQNR